MRFVLRRAGFFLLTLWAALTLNFFLPRMMPGNPAISMVAKFRGRISAQGLINLETIFGVNTHESLPVQYWHYLGDMATLNFGTSLFFFPSPVSQVVRTAIPWTLGLFGVATILAFILGTWVGIIGAWRRGGLIDSIAPPVFVIFSAIPYFWVGMMFILIFGLKLQWLPWSGGMAGLMIMGCLSLIVEVGRAVLRCRGGVCQGIAVGRHAARKSMAALRCFAQ